MCFQVEFTKEEQSQIDAQEENERADEQEFIDWFGDLDNPVPSKCAVPPEFSSSFPAYRPTPNLSPFPSACPLDRHD